MPVINGTEGRDTLAGTSSDDAIYGFGDDDSLNGGSGNDSLYGGEGADALIGGLGNDLLDGGNQRSALYATEVNAQFDLVSYGNSTGGVNVALGADGTNGIATGGNIGTDILINIEFVAGSSGNDTISGSDRPVNEIFMGGLGNDVLRGSSGTGVDQGRNYVYYINASGGVTVNLTAGTATGAEGNDTLIDMQGAIGGAYADKLTGSDAYDFFEGGGGNDTLDGGAGRDRASYTLATSGVSVNLLTGVASGGAGADVLMSIEDLRGTEYADALTGDDGVNDIQGRAGNDTISGGGGSDTLYGGTGDDSIDGGAGIDSVLYSGRRADYTVTSLGAGAWTVKHNAGTDGLDTLTGVENILFGDSTLAIVSLSPADATTGVPVGSDIVIGFSASIVLGSGGELVRIRDGGGTLVATLGTASTGKLFVTDNTLTIRPGNLLAGGSNYTVELLPGCVHDLAGIDFAGSDAYHFTTLGENPPIMGTAGNDNLSGTNGDDTLQGGAGNDTLDGGGGDDVLDGGSGNDNLVGGTGQDTLIGGLGADTMAGGDGADLYYLDDSGDVVIELATNAAAPLDPHHPADLGRSVDKVIASITYTLTSFVENLSLAVGAGGIAAYGNELANVLTGNEANNTLVGNAGDDTLDGAGGADTMSGGSGADTYYVDNAGDIVTETATDAQADQLDPRSPDLGRAVDKVIAGISYTLGSFVENLTLAPKAGNLAGTGNELNNELYGNEANNTLSGKAGNDTMDGGTGLDTALYAGKLAEYTVATGANAGSITLSDKTANRDGTDNLSNIERLKFSDGALALDMGASQAGGKAVLMLAVATSLGKDLVNLPAFAGLFLNYFDTGASLLDGATLLVAAGVTASFAGGSDNASLVKMVYADVYGKAPDAATLASLVAPLNAGSISQAQWLADMAASSANQQQVNLAGYAATGWQYAL